MNIYQRINEVRKVVRKIQKTASVSAGGSSSYRAVGYDYLVGRLHPHMVRHEIVMVPSVERLQTTQDTGMATKSGTPYIRVEATVSVRFVNANDPADAFDVVIVSHGVDNADKAPQKAITAAVKQALLKVLLLETGEKDEDRPSDVTGQAISAEQRTQLFELCDTLGMDRAYVDRLAVALGFHDSTELPASKMDWYRERLRAKAAELAAANG